MTRKKKGRKVGSEGPAQYKDKSPTQIELEGRLRQKARKRKGLKAGARHSEATTNKLQGQAKKDPRIGSKKPIPLIVAGKSKPSTPAAVKARRLSAEQELEMLENDVQLNALLDRLEAGESLGAGMQQYVDQKLDRIEALMDELGLLGEEEPQAEPAKAAKAKPQSDDDLLAQFEGLDLDQLNKE